MIGIKMTGIRNILLAAICCLLPATLLAQTQESAGEEYQRILEEQSRKAGFSMRGIVEKGSNSRYSVNGNDFFTDDKTRITGSLKIGSSAYIRGLRTEGDKFMAKNIIASSPSSARSAQEVNIDDYDHGDPEDEEEGSEEGASLETGE